MGTSKSYPGPTGRGPLLPPGAPPPLDDGRPDTPPVPPADMPSWASVKAAMSRLAGSSGAGRREVGRVVSRSVAAQGGGRAAAGAATAGRSAARNLGSFLGDVARHGAERALADRGIVHVIGQTVEYLLNELLDALVPPGQSLDDEVARRAMGKTLDELMLASTETDGVAALDRLSPEAAVHALEIYLAHYINTQLMQRLSDRNEAKSIDATRAIATESMIKSYVRDLVVLDLNAIANTPAEILALDWTGLHGQQFTDRIFVDAYQVLEASE